MLKNDKGFTLVELLATIVIIGVVMAIVIPASYGYIEKSRKKAFYINVKGIVDQVKKRNELDELDSDITVCYGEETNCSSSSQLEKDEKLTIKKTDDMKAITVVTYKDSDQRKYAVTASSSNGKYEITKADFYSYNYSNDDELNATEEDKEDFSNVTGITISEVLGS